MIVTINDELFDSHGTELEIFQLFVFGLCERHYIRIAPPFEPDGQRHINRWLADKERGVRIKIETALDNSIQALAHGPTPRPKLTIRVAPVTEPSWEGPEPVLPLPAACRLLAMPLSLLLENRHNDGNVIRALAPPHLRARFDHCEGEGWLERVQGGGLPEVLKQVEERGRDPIRALRHWVLYDSDARRRFDPEQPDAVAPWGPSKKSMEVGKACARAKIHAHRLWRRTIESYLPPHVLRAWALDGKRGDKKKRLQKVAAFVGLNDEQRHYFNMKDGLQQDAASQRGVSPIYDSDVQKNPFLRTGFGQLTGYLDSHSSNPFEIEQTWLKDSQMAELLPVIESIFERM